MSIRAFFDLDATMIYSVRSAQTDVASMVPVEMYKEKWIAYMTPRAVELLDELITAERFIPTTTRTVEQFQRINFSNKPKWAITCNGAVILKDGQELTAWTDHVTSVIPADRDKVFDTLTDFATSQGWVNNVVRNVFFYMVTPVDADPEHREAAQALARSFDSEQWVSSIQARKIYILPRRVDKAVAMHRVMELSGGDQSMASGDSRLDLRMMLEADHALRPAHGELWLENGENEEHHRIAVTRTSGATAAEEILQAALAL